MIGGGVNFFGRSIPRPAEIISDPHLVTAVRLGLTGMFTSLQASDPVAAAAMVCRMAVTDAPDLEERLRVACAKHLGPAAVRTALDVRARLIVGQIDSFVSGQRIQDVGCGDGLIGWFLQRSGRVVELMDVVCRTDPRAKLPFALMPDQGPLVLPPRADTALLLTVLHHADDPMRVLTAIGTAAPARVIVIESVLDTPAGGAPLERQVAQLSPAGRLAFHVFFDWFFNRIVTDNTYVPFNFSQVAEWEDRFRQIGYKATARIHLGIDQLVVPEVHELLVLDREVP